MLLSIVAGPARADANQATWVKTNTTGFGQCPLPGGSMGYERRVDNNNYRCARTTGRDSFLRTSGSDAYNADPGQTNGYFIGTVLWASFNTYTNNWTVPLNVCYGANYVGQAITLPTATFTYTTGQINGLMSHRASSCV
jgi:hypothetical protein